MNDSPLQRTIQQLQWMHGAALAGCVGALAVVGFATRTSEADTIPLWLALAVVAAAGVPAGFTVRYYRRRPLEREGSRDYTITTLFRIGLAVAPLAIAVPAALLSGSMTPALLGAAISGVLLAWTIPSEGDYRRHRALAEEIGPIPPDEKWGEAEEDEVTPWDDEHGGHGHGMDH